VPEDSAQLPALDEEHFRVPEAHRLFGREHSTHSPRFLMLYGSLRERSYSRLLTEEDAIGRWMRMITIPNQSSVAKAYLEFDDAGRMKPSAFYDRVVDVMEELVKFTLLTRDGAGYLVDRYSERKESAKALSKRVDQRSIQRPEMRGTAARCACTSAGGTASGRW
jgi:hypothetical protein